MMDEDRSERLSVMNERRKSGILCDFEVKVAGETFPVHRIVLHTSSEYFRAMFDNEMKESVQGYCEIQHVNPLTMKECIEFLYSGSINLTVDTVIDILKLSHQWLLTRAVALCEKFMIENMDSATCVEWLNSATIYDLEKFRTKVIKYISENLNRVKNLHLISRGELENLMKFIKHSPDKSAVAWIILKDEVNSSIRTGKPVCHLLTKFPVESLPQAIFQEYVLKDNHVSCCPSCGEYVTTRRMVHSVKVKDIKVDNCFRLKRLAGQYGADVLLVKVENFICSNFDKVCIKEEFVNNVTKEQLLCYVGRIQRSCKQDEFSAIISWLKQTPSHRSAFPNLFPIDTVSSSKYQCSLRSLTGEWPGAIGLQHKISSARRFGIYWLVNTSNCCYVRSLAKEFSCQYTVTQADTYIREHFHSIARRTDIGYLCKDAMREYLSYEDLYKLDEGLSIWTALENWYKHHENNTRKHFIELLESLHFDEMSLQTVQTISTNDVVRESPACTGKLMETLFYRLADTNNILEKQKMMIENRQMNLEVRLMQLEARSKNEWFTAMLSRDALWRKLVDMNSRLVETRLREIHPSCTLL